MPQGNTQDVAKPTVVGNALQLKSLLEKKKNSIAEVAANTIKPERLLKMALTAASKTPLLYKCTKISIVRAVMDGAELGLDISGQLGSAYLIPFYNNKEKYYEAVFMIGYRGLIDLSRRSGEISTISATAVHENDFFECSYGLSPDIIHRRPALGDDRGDIVGVYAVAVLTDGAKQFEVMDKSEIDKIRALSKAGGSGPWKDFYDEMARKTVIRRLAKYLPLSVEVQTQLSRAVEREDEVLGLGEITPPAIVPPTGDVGFGAKAADTEPAIDIEPETTPEPAKSSPEEKKAETGTTAAKEKKTPPKTTGAATADPEDLSDAL